MCILFEKEVQQFEVGESFDLGQHNALKIKLVIEGFNFWRTTILSK